MASTLVADHRKGRGRVFERIKQKRLKNLMIFVFKNLVTDFNLYFFNNHANAGSSKALGLKWRKKF